MTKPVVLFGGPSPEHDISISTGLQAAHTLGDVTGIYWAKNGGFHMVDAESEVTDFADGIPRKARELSFDARPGQGFVLKKKPVALTMVLNCCHGGPGEDGTIQGAMDMVGYRYSGPGQMGSALGMDKLAFGVRRQCRAASAPEGPARSRHRTRLRWSLHRQTTFWGQLDRNRGRCGLRDGAGVAADIPTPVGWRSDRTLSLRVPGPERRRADSS